MSDSENMIRDLAIMYSGLDALRLVESNALQNLVTVQTDTAQNQNDIATNRATATVHQDIIDSNQNALNLLNTGLNYLQNVDGLNLDRNSQAQQALDLARSELNVLMQSINDLKARIKLEVDDDFPT